MVFDAEPITPWSVLQNGVSQSPIVQIHLSSSSGTLGIATNGSQITKGPTLTDAVTRQSTDML